MNFRALFGWGITIYAIVFLVWSGLVIHELSASFFSQIIILVALITVTTVATRSLNYRLERDILPYAIGWVLIIASLDAAYAVPYAGWQLYADWNMWVGYALVLAVPLIVVALRKARHTDHVDVS